MKIIRKKNMSCVSYEYATLGNIQIPADKISEFVEIINGAHTQEDFFIRDITGEDFSVNNKTGMAALVIPKAEDGNVQDFELDMENEFKTLAALLLLYGKDIPVDLSFYGCIPYENSDLNPYVIENGILRRISEHEYELRNADEGELWNELVRRNSRFCRKEVPVNEPAQFVSEIIENFETFLEDRRIVLDNPEKEDPGNDPGSVANIYGSDYGELQTAIEDILRQWRLISRE